MSEIKSQVTDSDGKVTGQITARQGQHRQCLAVAPYLITADIRSMAEYFCEQLGFDDAFMWGEPPYFCILMREGLSIMLRQAEGARPVPNRSVHDRSWDAYLWVRDAVAEHQARTASGAHIISELRTTYYYCREFEVETPEGHVICFSQSLV
jgi:predicted enzyme related to lactoylglutathione lyase